MLKNVPIYTMMENIEGRLKMEFLITMFSCDHKAGNRLNALERLNGIKWIKCTTIVVLKDRHYDASYL